MYENNISSRTTVEKKKDIDKYSSTVTNIHCS